MMSEAANYLDMDFTFEVEFLEMSMPRQKTCCCSSLNKIPWGNKPHICQNKRKTLTQTCFVTLAKYFDRYLTAFNYETVPKLHSEFLQLMSDRLMTVLVASNKFVTLKQACFLINPCLKKLYLDVFYPADIDAILDKLRLTSIKIKELASGSNLSLEQVVKLVDILPRTLESLQLSKCSAVILKKVVLRCPALKNLNLSNCKGVTDRCIESLARGGENGENSKNTVLQILDIQNTDVSVCGCRFALENIPNLTAFCIPNLAHNIFSKFTQGPYNLKTLIYGQYLLTSRPDLEYYLMRGNEIYPYVTKLLVHYPLTQEGINTCVLFENLEDVALLYQYQCDSSPFLKKRGHKLKSFMIEGYNVHVSLQVLLEFCPLLQSLKLINVILEEVEALADSHSSWERLEDVVLKDVSFIFKTGVRIAIRHRPTLTSQLLFKRSCFINFQEFVDAIIRCTCINKLTEHGVDYPHVLPALSRMLDMAAPSINSVCIWAPHIPFTWP